MDYLMESLIIEGIAMLFTVMSFFLTFKKTDGHMRCHLKLSPLVHVLGESQKRKTGNTPLALSMEIWTDPNDSQTT